MVRFPPGPRRAVWASGVPEGTRGWTPPGRWRRAPGVPLRGVAAGPPPGRGRRAPGIPLRGVASGPPPGRGLRAPGIPLRGVASGPSPRRRASGVHPGPPGPRRVALTGALGAPVPTARGVPVRATAYRVAWVVPFVAVPSGIRRPREFPVGWPDGVTQVPIRTAAGGLPVAGSGIPRHAGAHPVPVFIGIRQVLIRVREVPVAGTRAVSGMSRHAGTHPDRVGPDVRGRACRHPR